MTAVFARGFAESLADGETLGLFNNSIAYETNKIVKTHVLSMVVAMFVGAANGFMGAIFTRINLKWRAPSHDRSPLRPPNSRPTPPLL